MHMNVKNFTKFYYDQISVCHGLDKGRSQELFKDHIHSWFAMVALFVPQAQKSDTPQCLKAHFTFSTFTFIPLPNSIASLSRFLVLGSFSKPGLRDSWKGEEGSKQTALGKSSQAIIRKC